MGIRYIFVSMRKATQTLKLKCTLQVDKYCDLKEIWSNTEIFCQDGPVCHVCQMYSS